MRQHLEKATKNLYLLSELHLLYLLTPFCAQTRRDPKNPLNGKWSSNNENSGEADSKSRNISNNPMLKTDIKSKSGLQFFLPSSWSLWNRHLNSISSDEHPILKVASLIGIKRSVLHVVNLLLCRDALLCIFNTHSVYLFSSPSELNNEIVAYRLLEKDIFLESILMLFLINHQFLLEKQLRSSTSDFLLRWLCMILFRRCLCGLWLCDMVFSEVICRSCRY